MTLHIQCRNYLRKNIIVNLILLVPLATLSGCNEANHSSITSDVKPPTYTAIEQPKSLKEMLVTNFGNGVHEAWICFDELGEPTANTFYDKGKVEGLENVYLGSKYSVRSNAAPSNYTWRVGGRDSITIVSPPLGQQDHWSNVMFSDSTDNNRQLMKANSEDRGQLYCSLEGRQ